MITKICTKCGVEKPLSEYNKRKSGKHGVEAQCRDCRKQYGRQYRKDNKEYVYRTIREWKINNPVKVNEYKRRWRIRNIEYSKKRREEAIENLDGGYVLEKIRRQYGLSASDLKMSDATPDMIEMKRRNLKYYRELNQLKKITK